MAITTTVNQNDPAFLFLSLHPAETIQAVVRKHPAGFLGTLLIVLAMAIFPILVYIIGPLAFPHTFNEARTIILLISSSFYLFLLTFLFGAWLEYYYDVIFITNERIINVAQLGLLSREVSELGLAQIEDVSARMEGFFQSLFNYGLLVIETAGEGTSDNENHPGLGGYFTIKDVPDPNRLARLVIELHRGASGDDSS
ncbi:MAG TPA: PH domain-containing protein [Candidatus Saccharimonadales bacterium]|nr:PH domain-containing protein [Candidatus Saccharimonadales bacterium]